MNWHVASSITGLKSERDNAPFIAVEVVDPGELSLGQEFNAAGDLTKLRSADQADPPQRGYVYDGLNRLTQTKDGSTNAMLQAYAYDQTGNRTSATVGGTTTAYSTGSTSHRLNAVGTTTRSYDAAGNTTQIGASKSFVYDDHGRLRQTLDAGVPIRDYAYNGLGQQVRRWAANDDRYSLYGEDGQWLGEYDTTGAPLQQIV
jgi:YD repeat-containing protein